MDNITKVFLGRPSPVTTSPLYKIKIPVIARAKPSDDSLTPSERSAVTEAVSLLKNSAQQLEEAKESFESNQLNVEFDDTENLMVFTKGVDA